MRSTLICLAAFLMAASLPAQASLGDSPAQVSVSPAAMPAQSESGQSSAALFRSSASSGCPIGIIAERRSSVTVNQVGAPPSAARTQGLELRFDHLLAPKIEQVTVVIHGLSKRGRVMPLDTTHNSDVQERFKVTRTERTSSLAASYIQPKRVFVAQWIELTSVDYTDGSNWHATQATQCVVTPNNLVLVAAR